MTFDISFQQITIGPLEIRFYSLLILSGLLAGVVLAQREAKRLQEDPTHVVNIAVVGSMMALVGARLYHVFDQDQWPYYRQNPGEIIAIWNGGIGTYVKASYQAHRDAVDPGNDGLRVNANQLHARVVGEGGNLGFTHAARVEFAANEGRINADSLDNSGGVDMSDHEVDLKILFSALERTGELNREQRNAILLKIAEKVSDRVQDNNESHSRMVSLDVVRSAEQLDDFVKGNVLVVSFLSLCSRREDWRV